MGGGGRPVRRPDIPGGVIYWDPNGKRKQKSYKPEHPVECTKSWIMTGLIMLVIPGMFFGLLALGMQRDTVIALVSAGAFMVLVCGLMIVLGCRCYHARKKIIIPLFMPGTLGVTEEGLSLLPSIEYMTSSDYCTDPPDGYQLPPDFYVVYNETMTHYPDLPRATREQLGSAINANPPASPASQERPRKKRRRRRRRPQDGAETTLDNLPQPTAPPGDDESNAPFNPSYATPEPNFPAAIKEPPPSYDDVIGGGRI